MPKLLDQPTPEAKCLLAIVASARDSSGAWPVWQYVARKLLEQDLDPEATLRALPMWQHHYRSIWTEGTSGQADLATRVGLTVHGWYHCGHDGGERRYKAFVTAVRIANAAWASADVIVDRVVPVIASGAKLAAEVAEAIAQPCGVAELKSLLTHEPSTWSGITQPSDELFDWDVSAGLLHRYRGIRTVEDYFDRLELQVGMPDGAPYREALPASALPDALDHLDVTWRLLTRGGLFATRRHAPAARLVLAVNSAEEFDSRCSAIADILSSIKVDGSKDEGPLVRLGKQLALLLSGAGAERAQTAVLRLRDVVAVRAGQQHSDAAPRGAQAAARLGLATYGTDWAAAWQHIRAVATEALVAIREELSLLVPH